MWSYGGLHTGQQEEDKEIKSALWCMIKTDHNITSIMKVSWNRSRWVGAIQTQHTRKNTSSLVKLVKNTNCPACWWPYWSDIIAYVTGITGSAILDIYCMYSNTTGPPYCPIGIIKKRESKHQCIQRRSILLHSYIYFLNILCNNSFHGYYLFLTKWHFKLFQVSNLSWVSH